LGSKKVYKDIKSRFYLQFLAARKRKTKFNFRTDKLAHYKKGFKKYFLNVATLTFGVSIRQKQHGLKRNNNCIERDHQYSRALEKNCRGHKDFEGISALYDVGDAYYNYIDKQKLKDERTWRTPAQRAKIKLKLGDSHHLLGLILKAYAEE
jgi:transposase-like protein